VARSPPALVALAAIVAPRERGKGWSARLVAAMVPLKGEYPLTPMREYARWRRPDGTPFDPWLPVHWRLGARILRITPRGNTADARGAEWETWTGLRFPVSGRYVVPGAFQPIRVDRQRDRVDYEEANVWMLHRVPAARGRIPRGVPRPLRSRARSPEDA
jgi:hypothetical protein